MPRDGGGSAVRVAVGGLEVWVVARQGVARHGVGGLLHAMEVYVGQHGVGRGAEGGER